MNRDPITAHLLPPCGGTGFGTYPGGISDGCQGFTGPVPLPFLISEWKVRFAFGRGKDKWNENYLSLMVRMVNWQDHINSDPEIMLGKPCFRGTRIPVDLILEKLAYGESEEEILKGYPRLSPESIRAALLFAVDSVRNDITYAD